MIYSIDYVNSICYFSKSICKHTSFLLLMKVDFNDCFISAISLFIHISTLSKRELNTIGYCSSTKFLEAPWIFLNFEFSFDFIYAELPTLSMLY